MTEDLSKILKQIDEDIHSLQSSELKQKYLSKNRILTEYSDIRMFQKKRKLNMGKS
jgi:hypothetical protein